MMTNPKRDARIKQSFVLSLFLTLFSIPLLALFFLARGQQKYTEPIVGLMTWHDFYKAGDYPFFASIFAVFSLFLGLSYLLVRALPFERFASFFRSDRERMQIFSVAAGLIAGLAFCNVSLPVQAILLLPIVLFVRPLTRLLVPLFFYFSSLGVFCAVHWASHGAFSIDATWTFALPLLAAALGCTTTYVWPSQLNRILAASQTGIPLLLLRYCLMSNGTTAVTWNIGCQVVLWIVVGFMIFKALRLVPRGSDRILIGTVAAIAAYLVWTPSPASISDFLDDFHFGEMLLPWQQVLELKLKIYSEFVPIQGLLSFGYGFLNHLFFDGTAATFPMAFTLLAGLVSAATAAVAYSVVGSVGALALTPMLLPFSDRMYLVPLFTLILLSKRARANPLLWLGIYLITFTIHFLWNAPSALALALGFFPLALHSLWQLREKSSFTRAMNTKSIAAVIFSVLFFTAVFTIMRGELAFVRESSSEYALTHGATFWHQFIGRFKADPSAWALALQIRFEIVRTFSQFFGVFALAYFLLMGPFLVIPAAGILFTLGMFGYSFNTIDTGQLSRVGSVSMLVLGFFIPLCVALRGRLLNRNILGLFLLGLSISFPLGYRLIDWSSLAANSVQRSSISSEYKTVSALYYYLNQKVPCRYPSDHLVINAEMQSAMVACLDRTQPTFVLLDPSIRWGLGPVSLRSYRVYRWFMKNSYVFGQTDGLSYLLRKDKASETATTPEIQERGLSRVFYTPDLMYIPLTWGRNFIYLKNLFQESPARFSTTSDGQSNIWHANRPFSGSENDHLYFHLKLEKDPISWESLIRSGLPKTQFVSEAKQIFAKKNLPEARLLWAARGQEFSDDRSVRFAVKSGDFLIPMGSDPRWLKSNQIERIQIEIPENSENRLIVTGLRAEKLVE
jgi:hypothetical protein